MKVGIITFHHAFNYGAFHQASALVRFLKDTGMESELIDYRNPALVALHEYCISPGWNPFSWRYSNPKRRENFVADLQKLPLSPRAIHPDQIDWSRYDAVVYGSDEIWNHTSHAHAYDSTYFGCGCPETVRKVAYAPSLGELDSKADRPSGIEPLLRSFHALSVRDRNAESFVARITGSPPSIVVDPVLLDFGADESESQVGGSSDFVLVYGEIKNPKTTAACQAWAKARGLKTVSFGFHNRWCDSNLLTESPVKFPEWIQNSSFVLTSTFHGTMFAIRHGKPFVTFRSGNAIKKFDPLLESLGLSDRVIADGANLSRIPDEIDYSNIHEKLRVLSSRSRDFLVKSLQP